MYVYIYIYIYIYSLHLQYQSCKTHTHTHTHTHKLKFTYRHQMATNVTRLNSGVTRNSTRWKEMTSHTIPVHGIADDI